jgi:hypothetical protein
MDKNSLYKCLLQPYYLDSLEVGEIEALYDLYPNNLFVIKVLNQLKISNQLSISSEFLKKCSLFLPGLEVASFPVSAQNTDCSKDVLEPLTEDVIFHDNATQKAVISWEEPSEQQTDVAEMVIPSEQALVEDSEVAELTQPLVEPLETFLEPTDPVPISRFTQWLKDKNNQIKTAENFIYFGQPLSHKAQRDTKKKKKGKDKRKKPKNQFKSHEIESRQDKKDNKRLKSVIAFANKSLVNPKDIVSETLAELFLEQGHYDKAIEQYRRLSLAFPEKSAFFAELIKKIENK